MLKPTYILLTGMAFHAVCAAEFRPAFIFQEHMVLPLHAGKAEGEKLGFVIEDAAGRLHYAEAEIEGYQITVFKYGVRDPEMVYCGFHQKPVLTVYSAAGLPLMLFRTGRFGASVPKAK